MKPTIIAVDGDSSLREQTEIMARNREKHEREVETNGENTVKGTHSRVGPRSLSYSFSPSHNVLFFSPFPRLLPSLSYILQDALAFVCRKICKCVTIQKYLLLDAMINSDFPEYNHYSPLFTAPFDHFSFFKRDQR